MTFEISTKKLMEILYLLLDKYSIIKKDSQIKVIII